MTACHSYLLHAVGRCGLVVIGRTGAGVVPRLSPGAGARALMTG